MSEFYGRKIAVTWDGTAVGGVKDYQLSIAGEPADITAQDDLGIYRSLDEVSVLTHDFTMNGVTREEVLREAMGTGDIQGTLVITYPSGYVITGTANLISYSEGLPMAEASTFDASFKYTGTVTHTPPSP